MFEKNHIPFPRLWTAQEIYLAHGFEPVNHSDTAIPLHVLNDQQPRGKALFERTLNDLRGLGYCFQSAPCRGFSKPMRKAGEQ